jgi:hypothetical protein
MIARWCFVTNSMVVAPIFGAKTLLTFLCHKENARPTGTFSNFPTFLIESGRARHLFTVILLKELA